MAAVNLALWVMMEAKPGKEAEVEAFLNQGLSLVLDEPKTVTWYAIKMGPYHFGIFADESGREAHLSGKVAEALMAKAPDLFAKPPRIEKVDIIAAKI